HWLIESIRSLALSFSGLSAWPLDFSRFTARLLTQDFLPLLGCPRRIPVRSTTPICRLSAHVSPQIRGHSICRSLPRRKLRRRLGIFQFKRIWSSAERQAQCFLARP